MAATGSNAMLDRMVAELGGHHAKGGQGVMVCCPGHEDHNPSLSVDLGADGRLLVKCFSGCEQVDVIAALKSRGLWPERTRADTATDRPNGIYSKTKDGKPLERVYIYRRPDGSELGHVAVYRHPGTDAKKIIPFFNRAADGAWEYGAAKKPRPLYGLDRLSRHPAAPVVLVEGEKAADALQNTLGDAFVVITWAGGSNAAQTADWTPLKSRNVTIWPDADDPGQKAATLIKRLLRTAALVRIPPNAPTGWDAADAIVEGWGRLELVELLNDTLPPIEEPGDTTDTDTETNPWKNPLALADLVDVEPPPIPWLFKDRFQFGRGGLLAGMGGAGKTTLCYQLAIGAITGILPWEWEVERTGRVMMILTEDTAEDVHRSLYDACRGANLTPAQKKQVFEALIIYPMAGHELKLLIKEGGRLVRNGAWYQLQQEINRLGDVVFLVIDPALSVTDGDEMDQNNQRALGKMVDDLAVNCGCTALLSTHATKGSMQRDEVETHASRGGGSITDAGRFEYVIRNMTAMEARKAGINNMEERRMYCQLAAVKGNKLPPAAYVPVWLQRDTTGIMSAADINFENPDATKDRDAWEILRTRGLCLKLADWRSACIDAGLIKGTPTATEKAMQRIIVNLKSQGLIKAGAGNGIWIAIE